MVPNESYRRMRARHKAEYNAFPGFFAVTVTQFDSGLKSMGLDPSNRQDCEKMALAMYAPTFRKAKYNERLFGCSPDIDSDSRKIMKINTKYILKRDRKEFETMLERFRDELLSHIANDRTGNRNGFLYGMFYREIKKRIRLGWDASKIRKSVLDDLMLTYEMLRIKPEIEIAYALSENDLNVRPAT